MANKIIFFFSLLICSLFPGCSNHDNSGRRETSQQKDSATERSTLQPIYDAKPKFPGFIPKRYIIEQDTTFIRIISNSKYFQKAWMVYYDKDDRKWETITWIGSGENNEIIGDTVFCRKNGITTGSSINDAPEFYFAFSRDSGKTWQAHEIYEGVIKCKQNDKHTQKDIQILASNDFLKKIKRPSLGLILQHHYPYIISTDEITAKENFDFYCGVATQLSYEKVKPSQSRRNK
ncbi:MAG: hypothetical protein ABI863_17630 [Ginsengibacter sp.]